MKSQPARRHIFNMSGDEPEEVGSGDSFHVDRGRREEGVRGEDQWGIRAAVDSAAKTSVRAGATRFSERGDGVGRAEETR